MFSKHRKKSKRLKPIRITLDMAKKIYDKGGEYRYVVCVDNEIPHSLCKTYKEAAEVCSLNPDI